MSKRNTIPVSILSALVVLMLCLLSGITSIQVRASQTQLNPTALGDSPDLELSPQKVPESTAGSVKPVRGIDVIVQKNPGNTAVRTVTTDSAGHFTLPVLPVGSYALKLDLPQGRGGFQVDSNRSGQAGRTHTSYDKTDPLLLTIEGAADGPIKAGWSFETNATVDVTPPATEKTTRKLRYHEYTPTGLTTIIVKSDGKKPLTGMVETVIIKSKSNITNN